MKKIITFGHHNATLERVKSTATIKLNTVSAEAPIFYLPLAELADAINESESLDVITILPNQRKIVLTIEKGTSNNDVVDLICDAVTRVFDTDTVVANERAEEIV